MRDVEECDIGRELSGASSACDRGGMQVRPSAETMDWPKGGLVRVRLSHLLEQHRAVADKGVHRLWRQSEERRVRRAGHRRHRHRRRECRRECVLNMAGVALAIDVERGTTKGIALKT